MNIDPEILHHHQELSPISERFLSFLEKHPEYLKKATFIPDQVHLDAGAAQKVLQPWPLFVGGPVLAELKRATVGIPNLIKSLIPRFFGRNIEKIEAFYGFGTPVTRKLLETPQHSIDSAISRCDLILHSEGLSCIEVNFSTMLGGWQGRLRQAMYLQLPLISAFLREEKVQATCSDPIQAFLEHVVADTLRQGIPKTKVLNTAFVQDQNTGPAVSHYLNQVYQAILNGHSLKGNFFWTTYSSLRRRHKQVIVNGKRLHALIEFVLAKRPGVVYDALAHHTISMYNTPLYIYLMDKKNLALLSENQDNPIFTKQEQALIRDFVPWTRVLQPGSVVFKDETVELVPWTLQNRDQLVLKKGISYKGEHVLLGSQFTETQWEEKVAQALDEKGWIVQVCKHSKPYLFWDQTQEKLAGHDVVWGTFSIGNTFHGGFVRTAVKNPGKASVINVAQGAAESMIFEV